MQVTAAAAVVSTDCAHSQLTGDVCVVNCTCCGLFFPKVHLVFNCVEWREDSEVPSISLLDRAVKHLAATADHLQPMYGVIAPGAQPAPASHLDGGVDPGNQRAHEPAADSFAYCDYDAGPTLKPELVQP